MSMLYLTPVLPLGLVSYMCGTTSMRLASFAAAKIASLPLYLLYTFIGASAHSFIKHGATDGENVTLALEGTKKIEENKGILLAGLGRTRYSSECLHTICWANYFCEVLSTLMMTLITRHIRKELMQVSSICSDATTLSCIWYFSSYSLQILENQKRDKNEKCDVENGERLSENAAEESGVELGLTARRRAVK